MSNYIEIPIETDPDILAQEGFDFIQSRFPEWVPNDGNLETVMIEANARLTAEARDVASAVPTDIFRYFGQLVGVPPHEAAYAQSTVTFTAINNSGYTIPAATQLSIHTSGNELIAFETLAEAVIPGGSTTVTLVGIQAIEAGVAASGLPMSSLIDLLDPLDYIVSVTLDADTTGGMDAETDDEYLNRLVLRLQMLAPRPILARDFAVFALDIDGVSRATAIDGYNPLHNLLTANQSSIETDATGWQNDINCAVARSTVQKVDGVASLTLTASSAADMSARTTPAFAVVPGDIYSAVAQFRAVTTGRNCRVCIRWYSDAGGTSAISDSDSTSVADVTGSFVQASVQNAIAPINAVTCRVIAKVIAPANTEVHYIDVIQLRRGPGIDWVIGGTAETGNDRMVTDFPVDADGEPVSSGIKIEIDNYLESLREVNFITFVADPFYTTIDVQFVAKALQGYDTTLIHDAIIEALTQFLSPANWGFPQASTLGDSSSTLWFNKPLVRYLELSQAINEVIGVDYVTTLALRSGSNSYAQLDVNLGGIVGLPRPGSITGTVT